MEWLGQRKGQEKALSPSHSSHAAEWAKKKGAEEGREQECPVFFEAAHSSDNEICCPPSCQSQPLPSRSSYLLHASLKDIILDVFSASSEQCLHLVPGALPGLLPVAKDGADCAWGLQVAVRDVITPSLLSSDSWANTNF